MPRFITLCCIMLCAACGPAEEPPADEAAPVEEMTELASEDSESSNIHTETINYNAGGVTLQGYLAYDPAQGGERPGVLVVHEWWGQNDYIRRRARMLAELGYTALAVDMYGDGKNTEHPEDANKFMMEVLGNLDVAEARFRAAYDLIAAQEATDPAKIAAIGYCFGGAVVLHMARTGMDLEGVASFHGNLATKTPAEPGNVKAKVLVLHGADDPFVPAEQVEAFKSEMESAKVDLEFLAYPGAVHSFTNPGATAIGEEFDLPLAYDESADEKSWAKLDSFLEEIFSE